ncbi:MAG: hypothetical protein JWO35_409 [Candidatus Saccharibacteria bacterium]|nr:hypothetical protein [Candidatus Saccharibacteria bacterium]
MITLPQVTLTKVRSFYSKRSHIAYTAVPVVALLTVGIMLVSSSPTATHEQQLQSAKRAAKKASAHTSATDLPAASTAANPATSTGSNTTSRSSTATTAKPSTPVASPSPSTPAAQTQTPLSVLTAIIANLQNGISADVTASTIAVPGPIGTAQARPIVFTANGQAYFAYTQGQKPNFNMTPSQTASTMAIVTASQNVAFVKAHLDKLNNLVDPDITAVGYSTGGN